MDDREQFNDPGPRESGVPDPARRRLLKLAAYASPFVLSFGLPESGWAGPSCKPQCQPQCNDCKPKCGSGAPVGKRGSAKAPEAGRIQKKSD